MNIDIIAHNNNRYIFHMFILVRFNLISLLVHLFFFGSRDFTSLQINTQVVFIFEELYVKYTYTYIHIEVDSHIRFIYIVDYIIYAIVIL